MLNISRSRLEVRFLFIERLYFLQVVKFTDKPTANRKLFRAVLYVLGCNFLAFLIRRLYFEFDVIVVNGNRLGDYFST